MDEPMKKRSALFASLMISMMAAGAVHADSSPPSAAASLKVAEADFGRLSADGMSAFEDIHLARMAIFDGNTDEAAKFVIDAKASLANAKSDGSAFLKAESALRPPLQALAGKEGTPVIWIPIDSRIDVGDSFRSTAEQTAAVVTAKKHLMKGEGAKALQLVKSASLDIDYTLAVAPLEKSMADIDEAEKRIAIRDYYGASQALRHAEAGIRFDEIDDVANVKSGSAGSNGK